MKRFFNIFLILALFVNLRLLTSCTIQELEHVHNYVDGICTLCKQKSADYVSIGLKYKINDDNNSYSVISIGTCTDVEIIIPSEYDSLPVTGIGTKAFINLPNLEKIIIPNSVVSIGNSAFVNCPNLKQIELPDSIKSIGKNAFENCPKLEYNTFDNAKYLGNKDNPYVALMRITNKSIIEYKINDKTKLIYGNSFENCDYLTNIVIPASVVAIEALEFASCLNLENIEVDENNQNYQSIDGNLYSKDGKILVKYAVGKKDTNFVIPSTVETIGDFAFRFCEKLENIEIPETVISIGDSAFYNCSSLTNITLPNKITKINSKTFAYCEKLANIEIPTGVISIEKEAFRNCMALTKVVIPDGVKNIGDESFFHCEKLVDVEIPSSITSIGDAIFSGCYNLNCNIYEGIKYLGNENNPYVILFSVNNKDIESVEINKNVKFIMSYAFINCISLKEIKIPSGVIGIGDSAFNNCQNLEQVEIPTSITIIGNRVFAGCGKLKNIEIPNSVIGIGEEVFDECSNLQYNIYDNVKYLGNEDNPYLILVEPINKNLISYNINENTKIISPRAFYNCVGLSTIIIPNSVEIIGYSAFRSCERLINVIIPDSVISMDRYVFENCPRLTILCKSHYEPSGWENYWNADNRPVEWGYIEE